MTAIRRFANPADLPPDLRGGVVAIGNFDGVHRGHLAVLDEAVQRARAERRPLLVLTFEPHPRDHFRPAEPLFRLTPAPLKARLLGLAGVDAVVEMAFDAKLAETRAADFVQRVLVEGLGAAHVVTGFDFHFGQGREGGPAYLREAGERLGFGVTCIEAFGDEGGETVSSSRIRELLSQGEVAEAAGQLGYRFTVEEEVTHGQKLGRTLGFPTANMALPAGTALRHGIYAVRLREPDGTLHDGVASFGRRPTVEDDGRPLLETYVFDYAGDLYGKTCTVSFFGYLRPELKFDGLDPLVAQMNRDAEEARALLAGVRPLSEADLALGF
ncbi:MAG: bifunctional riboflavin kinase/FAD synthetase [Rhizobiaceae bacterium]|nr:bifunctional riboflavin kinase/FAD synthetase [Rhizobiaceae bacterium]